MKINLLDLFSGIGGFHLGLERAGFEVNAFNSEVDKYAIETYKNNFKDSTYVGSVTDVRAEQLPRIDGITFGSPCQDFSLAGKRKGLDGGRSSLILEAIRLIEECRPSFFIWENVKGTFSSNNRRDFAAILQAFANIGGYRLEWQLLNTKWFLPQNRERVYLVGYIANGSGGQIFPIGENNSKASKLQRQQADTCTLTARYYGAQATGSYIVERKFNEEEIRVGTLCANYARNPTDGSYVKQINPSKESGGKQPYQQNRIYDTSGLSPCLLKDKADIIIKTNTKKGYDTLKPGDSLNYAQPTSKTRRGRVGKGIAQTLDTGVQQAVYTDRLRRLTPIECERLQGFPDNWTEGVSDSQRYKMLGNAVTVDVVQEIGSRLINVI